MTASECMYTFVSLNNYNIDFSVLTPEILIPLHRRNPRIYTAYAALLK